LYILDRRDIQRKVRRYCLFFGYIHFWAYIPYIIYIASVYFSLHLLYPIIVQIYSIFVQNVPHLTNTEFDDADIGIKFVSAQDAEDLELLELMRTKQIETVRMDNNSNNDQNDWLINADDI
jgi:hypothetical protein